jgi:hypothetical protein
MSHWTVRVRVTSEDLDTGKVRAKMESYLVSAETIEQAQALIREHFRGMTLDHEVRGISKSGILEYIDGSNFAKNPTKPVDEYDKILNKA